MQLRRFQLPRSSKLGYIGKQNSRIGIHRFSREMQSDKIGMHVVQQLCKHIAVYPVFQVKTKPLHTAFQGIERCAVGNGRICNEDVFTDFPGAGCRGQGRRRNGKIIGMCKRRDGDLIRQFPGKVFQGFVFQILLDLLQPHFLADGWEFGKIWHHNGRRFRCN